MTPGELDEKMLGQQDQCGALFLIMVQLTVQSASADAVLANIGQWLVPIGTIAFISLIFFKWRLPKITRVQGAYR